MARIRSLRPRGGDSAFALDHITPVAFGGTDSPTNLQASHRECNREKGASI